MGDVFLAVIVAMKLLGLLLALAVAAWLWAELPKVMHRTLRPNYRRKIEEKYGPQSLWQDRRETRKEIEK